MQITEETDTKLVVKKTHSNSWLYMLGASVVVMFMALAISSFARMNKVEPRGSSRAPAGAVLFVFPVGALIFYFLDRRQNRKALIIDSDERTATVVGSREFQVPFDEINRFCLGRAEFRGGSLIEMELKSGLRASTGIDAHRGNAADVEMIMQKLGARLKAARSIPDNAG